MMRRRAAVAGVGITFLMFVALSAQPTEILVEDWSKYPVGVKGIPQGWKGQDWGSPAYDMTVVEESPTKVFHLKSRGDSSTITREMRVNVKEFPILEWQWKAVVLPKGADARKKATDDEAIQLYATFFRFPCTLRCQIIGYIWDSTAPEGTVVKSQKNGLVTYVMVRSGEKDLGKWIKESRNVYEDFKKIYGEEPGELVGVSISIDSDDTRSSAEAYMGAIRFRKP